LIKKLFDFFKKKVGASGKLVITVTPSPDNRKKKQEEQNKKSLPTRRPLSG
jgi:hypothetical protein